MDGQQRLGLAPGVRVVGLGRRAVQVGLEHGRAVRLPRTPDTERALTALMAETALPGDGAGPGVIAELAERGLAVPLRQVAASTVAVLGTTLTDLDPLLAVSGLVRTTETAAADVVLVAAAGELDRELLAPIARAQQPHLPLRLVDGIAILGPFAVPGRSACLRCVDLHRAGEDAAHLLLVDRYARAGTTDDLVLDTLAVAWAVRDLATWAAGGCPSTWSRTVRLDPALGEVSAQTWWRHPECGCTWGEGPSATMEA